MSTSRHLTHLSVMETMSDFLKWEWIEEGSKHSLSDVMEVGGVCNKVRFKTDVEISKQNIDQGRWKERACLFLTWLVFQ